MKTKHWIVFITLGLIWSSSFMWVELALREVGPITLVAVRGVLGVFLGAAGILVRRRAPPRPRGSPHTPPP